MESERPEFQGICCYIVSLSLTLSYVRGSASKEKKMYSYKYLAGVLFEGPVSVPFLEVQAIGASSGTGS